MSIPVLHLDFFRGEWATRLVDEVVVKSQTGETFDPVTGAIVPTYTEVYDGAALIRPTSAGEAEFGEALVSTADYFVFIPHTVVTVEPEMVVDVTSTHDGQLDGISLVVNNVNRDTYVTVRRLDCTHAG